MAVNVGTRVAKSATEALKILWEDAFFSTWKQKAPVVEALAKKGNHFSDAELGMALMRASYLTRRGKRGQYEYIQKYPFMAEKMAKAPKKGGVNGREQRRTDFEAEGSQDHSGRMPHASRR